jgi:hypothetical protein
VLRGGGKRCDLAKTLGVPPSSLIRAACITLAKSVNADNFRSYQGPPRNTAIAVCYWACQKNKIKSSNNPTRHHNKDECVSNFVNTRTPLLVTKQKVGKSAFLGKSEIDLFVVSKLRPSNYGHSGLNFRKTRVQFTVKLHLCSLQKIRKAELSTWCYIIRRLPLSYKHPIGLAC